MDELKREFCSLCIVIFSGVNYDQNRVDEQAVEKPLSKKILSDVFVLGDVILIDVYGAELVFRKRDKRVA